MDFNCKMTNINRFEEYSSEDGQLKITVIPEFLLEQSKVDLDQYAFSYTVQIENIGQQACQLINRHWKIFSGHIQIEDIKGQGVVGEQPVINPRESYQYNSWAMIRDQVGKMAGWFTFRDKAGNFFEFKLPVFDLMYIKDKHIN